MQQLGEKQRFFLRELPVRDGGLGFADYQEEDSGRVVAAYDGREPVPVCRTVPFGILRLDSPVFERVPDGAARESGGKEQKPEQEGGASGRQQKPPEEGRGLRAFGFQIGEQRDQENQQRNSLEQGLVAVFGQNRRNIRRHGLPEQKVQHGFTLKKHEQTHRQEGRDLAAGPQNRFFDAAEVEGEPEDGPENPVNQAEEQQERLEISPGVTETVRRSSCERDDAVAERFMPEALKRVAGLSGGIFPEFHDVFPV